MNEKTYDLAELRRNPVSRRGFLTRMTAAGLGLAAASLLAGTNIACGGSDNNDEGISGLFDPANFPGIVGRNATEVVLNYALTLEILEADLYRQALNLASGRAIDTPLDGGTGPTGASTGAYTLAISSGLPGATTTPGFLYLAQYAYVEAAHRDFLTTALASIGAPLASPNPAGYQLPTGTGSSLRSILELLYAVEETGVRAYLGAAGFMNFSSGNDKAYVQTAVAIHSTEARHSAGLAYVLDLDAGPVYSLAGVPTGKRVTDGAAAPNSGANQSENTFQYYSDPATVLAAVKPFIVGA